MTLTPRHRAARRHVCGRCVGDGVMVALVALWLGMLTVMIARLA